MIRKIIKFDKIDSTNKVAKLLLRNNLFITAKEQSDGKTSKSKLKWQSPLGNLYLSSCHKIESKLIGKLQTVGLVASYSAFQVIKKLTKRAAKHRIKMKWPNDLLIDNKKVGGVLVEIHNNFLIVGIGINIKVIPDNAMSGVHRSRFPTSLKEQGIKISVNKFTRLYRKEFLRNLKILKKQGFEYFLKKQKENYYKIGEEISLPSQSTPNEIISGIFSKIDSNGALILTNEEFGDLIFTNGDIE